MPPRFSRRELHGNNLVAAGTPEHARRDLIPKICNSPSIRHLLATLPQAGTIQGLRLGTTIILPFAHNENLVSQQNKSKQNKPMNTKTIDDAKEEARALGERHGINAAGWVARGARESAKRILRGIEDGDPMILDAYKAPDLSGEFSGDLTPRSLLETVLDPADLDEVCADPECNYVENEICTSYEDGAQNAFWEELERLCRFELAE